MKEKTFEVVTINRPFYFLCGPSIDHSEKRNVFSRFLEKQYTSETIRPFPIIVDRVFRSDIIKDYNLNMVLLEEIVAATSFKTYIFLDSLSTAYELGIFRNSKTSNNVTILVESKYEDRQRREVGEYIEKSIQSSHFLKYSCRVSDEEQEFFEFEDDTVPDNIKDYIQKEILGYSKKPKVITFTTSEKGLENPDSAFVKINGKDIGITFSLKALFYTMSVFLDLEFTNHKDIVALNTAGFNKLLHKFESFVLKTIVNNLGKKLDKLSLHNPLKMGIDLYPSYKTKEIIRHIYFFFVLLNEDSKRRTFKPTTEIFDDAKGFRKAKIDFYDLFSQIDSTSVALAKAYIKNPDAYVEKMSYFINKKRRTIYKYKDNYKGRQLRYYHSRMASILDLILPTNNSSYAYKKDCNALKCVDIHKNSISFLKLDIHHYFQSIKYRAFLKLFKKQVETNIDNKGYDAYSFVNEKELNLFVRTLFYRGSIPLGFITSPKVSDFYLKSVDDWASKKRNVIYSRYADDILFSTNTPNYSFEKIEKYFGRLIKRRGLIVNKKKKITKSLEKVGDYIKFLGICIVKKANENIIKISNAYVRNTIKECYSIKPDEIASNEVIMGKIRYIKNISELSYSKLIKGLNSNDKGKETARAIEKALTKKELFFEI